MVVLFIYKNEENPIKKEGARVLTDFPHCNPLGAFRCHGDQSSDQILAKTVCTLSSTPVMLQIKFDCNWHTCLRGIHV